MPDTSSTYRSYTEFMRFVFAGINILQHELRSMSEIAPITGLMRLFCPQSRSTVFCETLSG